MWSVPRIIILSKNMEKLVDKAFSLGTITTDKVLKTNTLNIKKAIKLNDNSVKIIKRYLNLFSTAISHFFNKCLQMTKTIIDRYFSFLLGRISRYEANILMTLNPGFKRGLLLCKVSYTCWNIGRIHDNKGVFAAVVTDYQEFLTDCIYYEWLIVKLIA